MQIKSFSLKVKNGLASDVIGTILRGLPLFLFKVMKFSTVEILLSIAISISLISGKNPFAILLSSYYGEVSNAMALVRVEYVVPYLVRVTFPPEPAITISWSSNVPVR